MLYGIIYLIFAFAGLIVNMTLIAVWPHRFLRLEWIWLLVLFCAYLKPLKVSGTLALLMGLMLDLTGSPFLGFFATVYFIVVLVMRILLADSAVTSLGIKVAGVGVFSMLAILLEWGLFEVISQSQGFRDYIYPYAFFQCALNMLVALVLFYLLDRFNKSLFKKVPSI